VGSRQPTFPSGAIVAQYSAPSYQVRRDPVLLDLPNKPRYVVGDCAICMVRIGPGMDRVACVIPDAYTVVWPLSGRANGLWESRVTLA